MPGIVTPDSVDSAWLTEQLQRAGHPGVQVRDFDSADVGAGQLGRCIRYTLDLVGEVAGVPRSVIGKFPSDNPKSRLTGVQLRNYLKEVSFYRELAPRLRVRAPHCYFAEIDGEGPEFALLLEDLAPALQGDQLRGCTRVEARAAVLELVGLHAPSWCDDSLRGIDWLGEPNDGTVQLGRMIYQAQLGPFLERYGDRLSADESRIIALVAGSQGPPFEPLSDVYTLVHVDYRLDNLLFDAREDPPAVAVVDWQSITLGNPLSDVAYFLGAGLTPELRRESEEAIVRDYHAALSKAGVADYPFERCWQDYRRGAFAGFAVTVIASMMVEQTERGDEMFTAMARRHARHAIDLDAEALLGID